MSGSSPTETADRSALGQADRRGDEAGLVSRTAAFVVDALLVSLGVAGGALVVNAVVGVLRVDLPDVVDLTAAGRALAAVGFTMFAFFVYYTAFLVLFGKTLGMLLFGLRVVRADGRSPGLGRAALRTACFTLSSVLFLGFVWVAIDNRRQAWHDKIARTFVVYDWEAVAGTVTTFRIAEPLVPRG